MTDREKIIEIIKKNGTYNGRSLSFDYYVVQSDDLADALIKAGYGDVKEWKERAGKHRVLVLPDGTIKQIYSNEEVEEISRQRDEYKHSAAVAERALLWLCDKTMSDMSVMVFPKTKTQVRNKQELYDYCIEQAEKELEKEERK